MSYHKDLDEYTKFELVQELARREEVLHLGVCDYCNRDGQETPCKFPERHKVAAERSRQLDANRQSRMTLMQHQRESFAAGLKSPHELEIVTPPKQTREEKRAMYARLYGRPD